MQIIVVHSVDNASVIVAGSDKSESAAIFKRDLRLVKSYSSCPVLPASSSEDSYAYIFHAGTSPFPFFLLIPCERSLVSFVNSDYTGVLAIAQTPVRYALEQQIWRLILYRALGPCTPTVR